jgi:AraC-like DNA-binding protein
LIAPPGGDPAKTRTPRLDSLTRHFQAGAADRRQVSAFTENAPRDVLLAALAGAIVDSSSSWFVAVAACRSFRHVITSSHRSAAAVRRDVREWMLHAVGPRRADLDDRLNRLAAALGQHNRDETLRDTNSLAAWLGASEKQLRVDLQREFNVAPRRLRLILRARPVIAALVDTDELVSQIGYRYYYDHPSDVDRDLGRLLGVSPRGLRRIVGGPAGGARRKCQESRQE